MQTLATPFRAYAPAAATVLLRAFAPRAHRSPKPARRRVGLPAAVVQPDEGTTCMKAVVAADEALRLAVGRTLAQRVVDACARVLEQVGL